MAGDKGHWESCCERDGVDRNNMATMKKHGMTDGLSAKCEELGVDAKGLSDIFYQFGPPCVPILMEFTHKAKVRKEPAAPKPKPEKEEKPADKK